MGEHREMTAIVRAINLPGTILQPTKEYRYIPPLPAGIVKSAKRQEKMLQKSRERGGAAHKKLGPEEIEKGIRLRKTGLTWSKTGEALGVTGDAVRTAIRRHGGE